MSNTLRNDAIATNTVAVDSFLTMSKVYLASIERLSALNLNAARESIEDCAAATKSLAETKPGSDFTNLLLSVIGQPLWEKAFTHSRRTYEIIAKTQEEMSKVIAGQLAQPNLASAGLPGWNAMSDMYTKGLQQFTASAAASAAAATGAIPKAVVGTTTDAKKVA